MKKLSLIIVLALVIQSSVTSQSCLPDGIIFKYQSDIDNFQVNFPNCTEIEGNVLIGWPTGDITNVDGLSVLTSIGGNLSIGDGYWSSPILTSLTGLVNVTSIGGGLSIDGNQGLTSLTGLDNITFVGGDISINSNPSLTSLTGLDNVDSIPDLTITNNASLSSCEEQWLCDYLSNPTGSVNIYRNAPGCNNPLEAASACGDTITCLPYGNYYFFMQADIDSFTTFYPNCTAIEGDITIIGDEIINLNGLNVVTSIGGGLKIGGGMSGIPNLTSLTGLENVTFIGGDLTIDGGWAGNPNLTNLTGLDNVNSIGGDLTINNNDALTSLSGLDNLVSIGGSLGIYGNNSLTSLTGLGNLNSIEGNLIIGTSGGLDIYLGNNALISLSGLENLTSIGGGISIRFNVVLTNLTGLENLTSVGGNFYIMHNEDLTKKTGLDNLTSTEEQLIIDHIDDRPVLTGSDIIDTPSVNGDLEISSNDALISITGLEGLTSIGGTLTLEFNNGLTSLSGLDQLEATSIESLYISYNPSLSSCEVQSICDYLAIPGSIIEIHDNATGCNSREEVDEACGFVNVNEFKIHPPAGGSKFIIQVFPNPFSTTTIIEYELSQPGTVRISIYNQLGGQVEVIEQRQAQGLNKLIWAPGNLPPGIYYFRLQADEQLGSGKMMLMR